MKIVDRATLMSLPAGTVFQTFDPIVFGEIMVKGETWPNPNGLGDFIQAPLSAIEGDPNQGSWKRLIDADEYVGLEVEMDHDCTSREGMFDPDQLYAVWSADEVRAVAERLLKTLTP